MMEREESRRSESSEVGEEGNQELVDICLVHRMKGPCGLKEREVYETKGVYGP